MSSFEQQVVQASPATSARSADAKMSLRDRCLRSIALLRIDVLLLLVFTVMLMAVVAFMGGQVKLFQPTVAVPIVIMGLVALSQMLWQRKSAGAVLPGILRDWTPFVLIAFIYENLYLFSKHVMSFDISPWMYAADVALFTVEPTIWIQQFAHPLLTDFMAFAYALYLILPLTLMFFLSLQNRHESVRLMVATLTFVFIIGFICYIVLPCNPPRYLIPHLYVPERLPSVFLYEYLQGQWDSMSVISGGAFPSLHVALSTVAMIYAWRFRHWSPLYRWLNIIICPLVVCVWIATVYLRHHWVVDIFAGWFVAWIAARLADQAMLSNQRLRRRLLS